MHEQIDIGAHSLDELPELRLRQAGLRRDDQEHERQVGSRIVDQYHVDEELVVALVKLIDEATDECPGLDRRD